MTGKGGSRKTREKWRASYVLGIETRKGDAGDTLRPTAPRRSLHLGFLLFLAGVLAIPAEAGARLGQEPQEKKDQEAGIPASLPKGKKLVLKDGNFLLVRSYERKGDRVRYYSVERSAWEELPDAQVDWEATQKAEAEEAKRQQELLEKMRAAEAAERATEVDVDASIEVAPGVFLPEGEGLYVVDGRAVLPLTQVAADAKLDKRRLLTQVLVPVPVVPTRHKVLLPGKHAEFRITNGQPEFYMRTADAREPELELIRAEVKGEARQIEFVDTNILGQQNTKRKTISVQRWQVAKGVYRVTLSQSLEPGEYVFGEILPEGMNMYVWDFGLNPPRSKPVPSKK